MLYVRISLLTAKPDRERQVEGIQDDLLAHYVAQHGFLRGYKLRSTAQRRQVGRVTVWRSAEYADAAAQSPRVLAQRAELQSLVEDEFEGSYESPEEPASAASVP